MNKGKIEGSWTDRAGSKNRRKTGGGNDRKGEEGRKEGKKERRKVDKMIKEDYKIGKDRNRKV